MAGKVFGGESDRARVLRFSDMEPLLGYERSASSMVSASGRSPNHAKYLPRALNIFAPDLRKCFCTMPNRNRVRKAFRVLWYI